MSNTWIQTFTGIKFDILNPTIEMICIEDIAHGLSNICRYGGQSKNFYSVAEHSWWISIELLKGLNPQFQLAGLMHDAAEAYIGDMVRPLKHSGMMEFFRETEDCIEELICEKFQIPFPMPKLIKDMDNQMLAREIADTKIMAPFHKDSSVKPTIPIIPTGAFCFSPQRAEDVFLYRFYDLMRTR